MSAAGTPAAANGWTAAHRGDSVLDRLSRDTADLRLHHPALIGGGRTSCTGPADHNVP